MINYRKTIGVNSVDKSKIFLKQLGNVQKLESTFLNQKENIFIKNNIKPAMDKLQDKIPSKFITMLDMAFYKGFQFVFQKGSVYIEKTYDKEKFELEHDLNNYAVDKYSSKKHLKKMDKQSNQSMALNQSISMLEGGILGVLGIGLPDIPIFLSVIIRTIDEIALSYGYPHDTEEEKAYILYVICGAMTKEEKQKEYDEKIDFIGKCIDSNIQEYFRLDDIIKETSQILSSSLLTAKLIQGLPIVGVIGGAINPTIINRIGKYARLKYKKRYLLKKINED